MGTPDPRYELRTAWPEVKLYARRMTDQWAQTIWGDGAPVIEFAVDLGFAQQTFALAHELGHLVAGRPCRSFCEADEREVVAWTARYLIPDVAELGDLLSDGDVASVAAGLGVPPEAVLDRLACMTQAETDRLSGRVPAADDGPPGRMAAFPRRTDEPPHRCKRARDRRRQ